MALCKTNQQPDSKYKNNKGSKSIYSGDTTMLINVFADIFLPWLICIDFLFTFKKSYVTCISFILFSTTFSFQ